MNLGQDKLSKSEWETIEVPTAENEKNILKLIISGYHDVNIHHNKHQSMFSFTKIEQTHETEYMLFKKYFEEQLHKGVKKYGDKLKCQSSQHFNIGGEFKKMKSADTIRIQNLDANIKENKTRIFEFLLIDLFYELLRQIHKKKPYFAFYLYTILQLRKTSIPNINRHVLLIIDDYTNYATKMIKTRDIITNAYSFIEKNDYLLKYEDIQLFPHQKQLFRIFRKDQDFVPRLVLYSAPTGTGKTLSPIGLSETKRIIFVCVARHIGLALAKAAISVEKKVAFAFGCETADDIRLHYFSALSYSKNRRSGGIGKVDNSVGDNVEIMICDVHSYLTAMHYMLAFNDADNVITYWDEPTITMDYENHELHDTINKNWKQNKIPSMVLSCATLPSENELQSVFDDFRTKFEGAEIESVTSFDCRKSIPIINKDGYCVVPHLLYNDLNDLVECVDYCEQHKTLLRYFDLQEIIRFIDLVNHNDYVPEECLIENYFTGIIDITMNSLKEYYLVLLGKLHHEYWGPVCQYFKENRLKKFEIKANTIFRTNSESSQITKLGGSALSRLNSVSVSSDVPKKPVNRNGLLITTSDAYTLTDGPTIFLCEDVKKISMFYIQQSNIPSSVFQNILHKITKNDELVKKIEYLEGEIATKETKSSGDGKDDKVAARESGRLCNESQKMMDQINKLRKEVRLISLDAQYIPNTRPHQNIWSPDNDVIESAFVSNIDEVTVKEVMMLSVDNNLKVLLLLGIGMFAEGQDVRYVEIIKKLADEQRLFIIVASSDYIYGTNYQFCHGFIGKDLANMTQQKTLQALGRIGRNNIQQSYTVRFRDDNMISQLFKEPSVNLEANNMRRLLNSD
jgi:hypothetical protein